MTDKTATQNLTRATPTDDPRQMPIYLQVLAAEVDARVTSHLHDIGRSRVPPFARLSLGTAYTATNDSNARMIFDTVDADTDNMADLSKDPTRLYFNSAGYWIAGGYVQWEPGTGPVTSEASVGTAGTAFGNRHVNDTQTDRLGITVGNNFQITTPGTQYVELSRGAFGSTLASWTFTHATLWAYKVRDL